MFATTGFLTLLASLVLASPEPPQGPTDPDSKALFERLVREAPPAWAELEAKSRKFRYSGRSQRSGKSRLPSGDWRESSSDGRVEFRQNGLDHLFARLEDPVRDGEQTTFGWSTALVANPRYAFVVRRPNANARYALEERGSLAESAEILRSLNRSRYMYITMMWGTSGSTPFREMIRYKTFSIKKISKVHEDGVELVRIEYDRDADPAAKTHAIRDAWAVFDPGVHWIAKEFGYTIGDGLQYTHQYTYDTDKEMFPILKSSTYTITAKESRSVFHIDFDTFEYAETPVEEFYTPYFGIEEPAEPAITPGFLSVPTSLLILGGLFGLVAVVLRLRPIRWKVGIPFSRLATRFGSGAIDPQQ